MVITTICIHSQSFSLHLNAVNQKRMKPNSSVSGRRLVSLCVAFAPIDLCPHKLGRLCPIELGLSTHVSVCMSTPGWLWPVTSCDGKQTHSFAFHAFQFVSSSFIFVFFSSSVRAFVCVLFLLFLPEERTNSSINTWDEWAHPNKRFWAFCKTYRQQLGLPLLAPKLWLFLS